MIIHPDWIYSEKIAAVHAFYYNEASDCYHLVVMLSTSYYPGWAFANFKFNALDGSYAGRETSMTSDVYIAMTLAWSQWLGPGLNNVFYMLSNRTLNVVNLGDLRSTGEWTTQIDSWNPPVLSGANPWMINRFDDIIGVCTAGGLRLYGSINSTPTMVGELLLPTPSVTGISFEDRSRCWLVTSSGILLKVNYVLRRWEVLTAVDSPNPAAKTFKVAYDTKRKQIGVFTWLNDAPDGSCLSLLSVYRPLYKAFGLTDPVPVQKLIAGTNIKFISHLHGGAGEGVATNMAGIEILSPAHGRMTAASALVELNGAIPMRYVAPPTPVTDTLRVSAGDI
jgi:hypothetical protein